jgi:superfamily I DNA/RNA helicase
VKIVAPRRLLEEARSAPAALARRLDELERRRLPAAGEAIAEPLDGDRLLGVEGIPGALALRFVAEVPASAPLGPLPPLAAESKLELLSLGVPAASVPALQAVRSLGELDALALPADVAGRVRFRLLQRAPRLAPLASSPPPDRCAADRAQLDRYLRGEIAELMLHLDPAQERIVALDGAGTIVVRGVAGSGKTAIALHRVFRLLGQRSLLGGPRLLFLTFNRALAAVARQLVAARGIAPGELEIATLHGLCRGLAPGGRLLAPAERRARLAQARAQVRETARDSALWRYPDAFWEEEIGVIKARVTGGEAEYRELRRAGAARTLDARLRALVWQVHEAYDAICGARGELDFDELVRRALAAIEARGDEAPRYDHVLVDEAQDFPAVGLRLAARLARPPGHLFLAYDPAQSIYRRGFRWKSCGVVVHGARSIDLRRNLRNTREILEMARPFLAAADAADEEDAPLEPELPDRRGRPVRRLAAPRGREPEALAEELRARIFGGVPLANVAVLAGRHQELARVEAALRAAGIAVQRQTRDAELRLADPSVKLLTFHSAKGLEFPIVYLLPGPKPEGDHADEAARARRAQRQRLLYVAMTRAMAELVVVTTAPG